MTRKLNREDKPTVTHDMRKKIQEAVDAMVIRQEAKKEFDRLMEGPAAPLDISLLEDIEDLEDDRYRIAGLMLWNANTILSAQNKTGKTTYVLNLAKSLITGDKFLGRDVEPIKPGNTVGILSYEMSKPQIGAWAHRVGIPADRFVVVNLRDARNPLRHTKDRQRLAEGLRERNVETLLVDSYFRAFVGDSQNDTQQASDFLSDLSTFAHTDCGALDLFVLAHKGWMADHTRGASGIEDWADSIISLKVEGKKGVRTMTAKGRLPEVDPVPVLYDPATHSISAGEPATDADTLRERIIGALRTGPKTVSQLSDALTISGKAPDRSSISKKLNEMEKDKQVTYTQQGKAKVWEIKTGALTRELDMS